MDKELKPNSVVYFVGRTPTEGLNDWNFNNIGQFESFCYENDNVDFQPKDFWFTSRVFAKRYLRLWAETHIKHAIRPDKYNMLDIVGFRYRTVEPILSDSSVLISSRKQYKLMNQYLKDEITIVAPRLKNLYQNNPKINAFDLAHLYEDFMDYDNGGVDGSIYFQLMSACIDLGSDTELFQEF